MYDQGKIIKVGMDIHDLITVHCVLSRKGRDGEKNLKREERPGKDWSMTRL